MPATYPSRPSPPSPAPKLTVPSTLLRPDVTIRLPQSGAVKIHRACVEAVPGVHDHGGAQPRAHSRRTRPAAETPHRRGPIHRIAHALLLQGHQPRALSVGDAAGGERAKRFACSAHLSRSVSRSMMRRSFSAISAFNPSSCASRTGAYRPVSPSVLVG